MIIGNVTNIPINSGPRAPWLDCLWPTAMWPGAEYLAGTLVQSDVFAFQPEVSSSRFSWASSQCGDARVVLLPLQEEAADEQDVGMAKVVTICAWN